VSTPQALPPWATVVRMERVAYWEPPPQDLVHVVNLDQGEALQLTGQRKELQLR
jgi:hypothetical protein